MSWFAVTIYNRLILSYTSHTKIECIRWFHAEGVIFNAEYKIWIPTIILVIDTTLYQVQIIMRRRFDDIKDLKDTWHVPFIDLYVFLNLRIAKVSEVFERPMTSLPFKSTRNPSVNAEGRRTRLNTPVNEFGRVQLRCHKAPIVKTPLHRSARCRYVHISRPIPGRGMRFYRGDPPLTLAGSDALCPREIWPDPVVYHLPPSASAEIFTKEEFQEAQKNVGHSEKCGSLQNIYFRRNVCNHTAIYTHVYVHSTIYLK